MFGFSLDAATPTNLHLIHLGRQEILKFKTSITPHRQHQKNLAWLSFSYVSPKIDGWNPLKNHGAGRCFSFSKEAFFSVPAVYVSLECGLPTPQISRLVVVLRAVVPPLNQGWHCFKLTAPTMNLAKERLHR